MSAPRNLKDILWLADRLATQPKGRAVLLGLALAFGWLIGAILK